MLEIVPLQGILVPAGGERGRGWGLQHPTTPKNKTLGTRKACILIFVSVYISFKLLATFQLFWL